MKIIFITILTFISFSLFAQGEYAGPVLKKLVGRTYTDGKPIPGLAGYRFTEGNGVPGLNPKELMNVQIFCKGTAAAVLFSLLTDTANKTCTIMDVLEIRNIAPGWRVESYFCRLNKMIDVELVAVAKKNKADFLSEIKQAWRFNRVKGRFQTIPVQGIDCFNEGDD